MARKLSPGDIPAIDTSGLKGKAITMNITKWVDGDSNPYSDVPLPPYFWVPDAELLHEGDLTHTGPIYEPPGTIPRLNNPPKETWEWNFYWWRIVGGINGPKIDWSLIPPPVEIGKVPVISYAVYYLDGGPWEDTPAATLCAIDEDTGEVITDKDAFFNIIGKPSLNFVANHPPHLVLTDKDDLEIEAKSSRPPYYFKYWKQRIGPGQVSMYGNNAKVRKNNSPRLFAMYTKNPKVTKYEPPPNNPANWWEVGDPAINELLNNIKFAQKISKYSSGFTSDLKIKSMEVIYQHIKNAFANFNKQNKRNNRK